MNMNQDTGFSSRQEDIRSKYLKDGVVFPLKVFDDNEFDKLECVKKYQEFRKKCEVHRTPPVIDDNQCKL